MALKYFLSETEKLCFEEYSGNFCIFSLFWVFLYYGMIRFSRRGSDYSSMLSSDLRKLVRRYIRYPVWSSRVRQGGNGGRQIRKTSSHFQWWGEFRLSAHRRRVNPKVLSLNRYGRDCFIQIHNQIHSSTIRLLWGGRAVRKPWVGHSIVNNSRFHINLYIQLDVK